ncbi:glycerol-3-phosphate ABC transporter ATP-binding protein [candidate division KSB1 bacterium]|nr:MAG: glycerol-3-phosphate ABC transporter ATP-binding protein [candidate division KSB1 bacterium]
MAGVRLRNVTKIFDKNLEAVKNLNLDVKDREFVVLVGPSGCGKSTTLRMIAGLEEVTRGEIFIDNRLVNNVPPKDRDIAMVFQNYALYPHMTVYQNMAFGLKLRKYPKDEIKKRVKEAASILGIEDLMDRKPRALSGGQKQRVAVGRAIVRKPKVFLFDEPLSNLDAKLRVQMRTEISKLHLKLGATIIYVTHDQVEAMTMGDKIVVMKDGKIYQIDTPLNLYNKPANLFVAGFIGSPSMNFFNGVIEKNEDLFFIEGDLKFRIPDRFKTRLLKYKGRKVIMGIRPEDIEDVTEKDDNNNKAELEVVEPMGNEIYLYLKTNFNNFVARVNANRKYQEGQVLSLYFNMDKSHFFDKETNISIIN